MVASFTEKTDHSSASLQYFLTDCATLHTFDIQHSLVLPMYLYIPACVVIHGCVMIHGCINKDTTG